MLMSQIDTKEKILDVAEELFAKTGYQGYVGQEFVPKRDPLTSLREAIQLCDV